MIVYRLIERPWGPTIGELELTASDMDRQEFIELTNSIGDGSIAMIDGVPYFLVNEAWEQIVDSSFRTEPIVSQAIFGTTLQEQTYPVPLRPVKRVCRCSYCGTISDRIVGNCTNCGAPLSVEGIIEI